MKRFPSTLYALEAQRPPIEVGSVIDCHQHLWPFALVEQLRLRDRGPRMDGWTVYLDGQAPFGVEPHDHDLSRRRLLDAGDGVDLALLSIPSPLGIEALDPDEATPLLDAWHTLADDIETANEESYGLWAAAGLVDPDLQGIATTLSHPRVHGLQVPATAMATPRALAALAPVLAVAENADLPVLVHAGGAPAGRPTGTTDLPAWWTALTSDTAQLCSAWFAWHVAGRELLPRLRVAFTGLAGLAPLHHERMSQRGGKFGVVDRLVYYETSSYGTRAIDAMTRVVGVDPLVHGSDRPYAVPTDPGLGGAFGKALFVDNPAHLMDGGFR